MICKKGISQLTLNKEDIALAIQLFIRKNAFQGNDPEVVTAVCVTDFQNETDFKISATIQRASNGNKAR